MRLYCLCRCKLLNRSKWVAFLVTAVLCRTAVTATVPDNVSGTIEDTNGAVIGGAYILIHPDPVGDTGPSAGTDTALLSSKNGNFSAPLSRGIYDVCVMATAFDGQCRKIAVSGKRTRLNFVLKSSPIVTRLTADPVY